MDAVVYLGDEISAAGWRLAGIDARACADDAAPAALDAALEAARASAALVLLSAALAARLDPALLRRAGAALRPLWLVVPDPQGRAPMPDLAARLRLQLGLEG
jgi:vacuolar-type H+-ATPase subunit F/Vma7